MFWRAARPRRRSVWHISCKMRMLHLLLVGLLALLQMASAQFQFEMEGDMMQEMFGGGGGGGTHLLLCILETW